MLYEIISPDAFLRPFLDGYTTVSAIYQVVSNAYARRVYVERAFQKKTNQLVQQHIGAVFAGEPSMPRVRLDPQAIETIKQQQGGKATKIINLVKAIQKAADENNISLVLVRWRAPRRWAYIIPELTMCETFFPQYERRTWRIYEENTPHYEKILVLGDPEGDPEGDLFTGKLVCVEPPLTVYVNVSVEQ